LRVAAWSGRSRDAVDALTMHDGIDVIVSDYAKPFNNDELFYTRRARTPARE